MKSMIKAILAVAAVMAIVVVSMPVAEAQCAVGVRAFASIGGGMNAPKARFDASSFDDSGTEIGRFWATGNSSLGNNWAINNGGTADPNRLPLGCVSQGALPWWQVSQTTLRGFSGSISSPSCVANTCPGSDMTYLVEHWGASGPPGIDDNAGFVAVMTNRDPVGVVGGREWDLQKPVGADGTVAPLVEHPQVAIITSGKIGNQLTINFDYADAGASVYVDNGSTTADTAAVASVDLLVHYGSTDPGRARYATCGAQACTNLGTAGDCCWASVATAAYIGGAITGNSFQVDCGDESTNTWVSAGVIFDGGGGGSDVASALVGRATELQCDPTLAEPEKDIRPGYKQRRTPGRQPSRSGR
jgi:hypothetical protein